MTSEDHAQQQCEQQNYWRCLSDSERLVVLNAILPRWKSVFDNSDQAIRIAAPDFDTIWPILQANDETRITNG